MTKPTFTSLESLRSWFFTTGLPFFVVYNGFTVKSNERFIKNIETEDMEAAWELLESNLIAVPSGKFRVSVSEKPNSTNVFTSYLNIASSSAINGLPNAQSQISGIYGTKNISEIIKKEIDSEREKWDMQQRIAQLENSNAPDLGIVDKIGEVLDRLHIDLNPLVQAISGMVANAAVGQRVTVQGINPTQQPAQQQQDKTTMTEEEIPEDAQAQAAIINDALQRLSVHFDLIDLLPKLVTYVEKNPEQSKNIINSIL